MRKHGEIEEIQSGTEKINTVKINIEVAVSNLKRNSPPLLWGGVTGLGKSIAGMF